METKNQLPYLPHELIIQILLRLPAKSLIRFKCVCKSWYSKISDTNFINSQFQLTAKHTHSHRALLIAHETHETRSIDFEVLLRDDSASTSLNPPVSYDPFYSFITIQGSCRGFILFLYGYFLLWNPSTGLRKKIPSSHFRYYLDGVIDYFYGFGYDQSTDDYLIVSMSSDIHTSYLNFFSLRANTWEEIDEDTNIPYSTANRDYRTVGSLCNGAIHWFANRLDLGKDVIVVFDLMERKLLDMNLPDEVDGELGCGLWVFQEFLSLWVNNYDNYDNATVEIWVMKEYKVHSSWTKTHVLPIHALPTTCFYPLTSTKSGDIVGTDGLPRFVKYNDEGQLLGHHSYCEHQYGSQVVMYIESLLSLPGDNVQA